MANLSETASFDPVYRLETATFVLGGEGGPSNYQAQALANRTRFLKDILDQLPSTTVRTLLELATASEVVLGEDEERAITPATLAARFATYDRTGLIRLALDAEVIAGTVTDAAVTPAGLAARTATTLRTGVVQLATDSEALGGTNATKALTPANLTAASDASATPNRIVRRDGNGRINGDINGGAAKITLAGSDKMVANIDNTFASVIPGFSGLYPDFRVRAWGRFAAGTLARIADGNVSSIAKLASGQWRVTMSSPMPDANYAIVSTTFGGATDTVSRTNPESTLQFFIGAVRQTGGGSVIASDPTHISFAVLR